MLVLLGVLGVFHSVYYTFDRVTIIHDEAHLLTNFDQILITYRFLLFVDHCLKIGDLSSSINNLFECSVIELFDILGTTVYFI